MSTNKLVSWKNSFTALLNPKVVMMLFLGFSAGLPLLLIFSSLSLWLREAGIERSAVTYFSWAALGYSFKFVWAPLVDKLPIPFLTHLLGRRRSWLLLSQFSISGAIIAMAMIDPALSSQNLAPLAFAAVLLGFSSATQDIVIDALRIESADESLQTIMSAGYIAGYRVGMIAAGAGALYLASGFGSVMDHYHYEAWKYTYLIMASAMLVGITTTLVIKEPAASKKAQEHYQSSDYLQLFLLFVAAALAFVGCYFVTSTSAQIFKESLGTDLGNETLASLVVEMVRLGLGAMATLFVAAAGIQLKFVNAELVTKSYLEPIKDFFQRYGVKSAALILALISLYRISDIVLGVISNVFYQDLGYSKEEIAKVVKVIGLIMTILGGYLGGLLALRFGVMKILFLGALLSAGTNLLFVLLTQVGYNMPMLYLIISADNLSAGLASTAFVAFLSSLTNISFTAMQYAIFSSLMTLLPKIIGGYSGGIVDSVGYSHFFLLTALMGIPVLWLIVLASRSFNIAQRHNQSAGKTQTS